MSQINDIAAITKVIQLYFDGTHFSDGDKLAEGFDQNCQIIGKTMRMERDQWIEGVRERQSPNSKGAEYEYQVKALHVDGDIGTATLLTPINGMLFTDVMTFLRTPEKGWQVVAKVFYRHPDVEQN